VAISTPPATRSVTLTIDGREVSAPDGTTIWEAARDAGIEIPVLCHDERYDPPVDAARLGLEDGGMARVSSRRGSIELAVKVSHREALGNVFIPFHFREAAANLLTIDAIDPMGKIPEFQVLRRRRPPVIPTGGSAPGPKQPARPAAQGSSSPVAPGRP
jgi:predicted molibdopterin-dependent oxidoreductase YjgC